MSGPCARTTDDRLESNERAVTDPRRAVAWPAEMDTRRSDESMVAFLRAHASGRTADGDRPRSMAHSMRVWAVVQPCHALATARHGGVAELAAKGKLGCALTHCVVPWGVPQ